MRMVFKRPSRSLEGEKGEFNSHRKTKVGRERESAKASQWGIDKFRLKKRSYNEFNFPFTHN